MGALSFQTPINKSTFFAKASKFAPPHIENYVFLPWGETISPVDDNLSTQFSEQTLFFLS